MKYKSYPPAKTKSQLGRPKDAVKRLGIVRAASKLFMKDGFTLTSLDAVAKEAGVSKLTIYSHFADKEDLFKEVIRGRCDLLAAPESYQALAKKPIRQALFEIGRNYVELVFQSDSIRLHRVMYSEAPHHPQLVRIFYEMGPKRVRESFGELLKIWCHEGRLSIRDIPAATGQFFSLIKGELFMRIAMLLEPLPSSKDLDAHVRTTVDMFLTVYSKTRSDRP